MESLVTKVTKVETEARERVAQVEAEQKEALADVIASRAKILTAAEEKARAEGEALIKERVAQTRAELNLLHQEEEQSLAQVAASAEKNHDSALARAVQLFTDTFAN